MLPRRITEVTPFLEGANWNDPLLRVMLAVNYSFYVKGRAICIMWTAARTSRFSAALKMVKAPYLARPSRIGVQ